MFSVVSVIELLDGTTIPLHLTDHFSSLNDAAAAGLELNAPFVVWQGTRRVLTWTGDKK